MPFKEHTVFEEPEDEAHEIWRYVEGTQFISLLQNRGLYFNRTDKFEDSFEGIFPKERLIDEYIQRELNQEIGRLLEEEIPISDITKERSPQGELFHLMNMFRKSSYLNCWHMNDSESMAMWKAYITGGDGVLIKSTYSKLKSAIDVFDDYTYRMGRVDYLSWLDDGVEEEIDEEKRNNWLYPLVYKQEEYEYEAEVRAIITKRAKVRSDENPTGIFVPTDLNCLIDSVIVSPNSPPWGTVEFWEDICRKYKLRTNVEKSSLEVTPGEIIEEIDEEKVNDEIQRRLERWKDKQDFL